MPRLRKTKHVRIELIIEITCPYCNRKNNTYNPNVDENPLELENGDILVCLYCNKKFEFNGWVPL